jgi:hypothetical protein
VAYKQNKVVSLSAMNTVYKIFGLIDITIQYLITSLKYIASLRLTEVGKSRSVITNMGMHHQKYKTVNLSAVVVMALC